ncbi:F-box protein At3g57580-like [Triticum urartu]|uniref:F-box protein At3g57580-like n=1 Tax=Triticum urartu TaxID=4572 RepID=UPI002044158A|nr:F-box protein At3g57580-like [Triticum urartu]
MEEPEKGEIFWRNTKLGLGSHPGATAASLLTDDLILEILCRLPVRSVHRFKSVSVLWHDLIADPANRKKFPEALAGFLYTTISNNGGHHHFVSVSGTAAPFDPSIPYLQPNKYSGITQVDACSGLLLYRRYNSKDDSHLVVCNPATGRWVELPPQPQPQPLELANRHTHATGLAFDPAVSSHFHVFHFEETYGGGYITGVNIYSSRTGTWSHRNSGMVEKVTLFYGSRCVFVGGLLYVMGNLNYISNDYVLLGVDMEGKVWKTISVQGLGTIGSSQGCLHYGIASVDDNKQIFGIELWCLQDCDSKELVLKHTARFSELMSMTGKKHRVVGIHPDCDTIFLLSHGRGDTLVAYDVRNKKDGCIFNLEKNSTQRFLAYAPLFSESLADAYGQ